MIKKHLSMILIYFSICLPANANEWFEIQNGFYANPQSIKEYYGTFGPSGKKTIWTILPLQEAFRKRYPTANSNLINFIFDCNRNKQAVESLVIYDKENNLLEYVTVNEYQLDWKSIPPNTISSFLFEITCNRGKL